MQGIEDTYHWEAVQLSKCKFFQDKINFLGHVVDAEGVYTDKEKTSTITSWPHPKNMNDVQQFLGLCNYYCRFVKWFSTIALPLTKLLCTSQPFTWNSDTELAFCRLKSAITSAPVLHFYNTEAETQVEADCSKFALGTQLLQKTDNKWHPVAFESCKLTDAEVNYPQHEKELLALIHALKK